MISTFSKSTYLNIIKNIKIKIHNKSLVNEKKYLFFPYIFIEQFIFSIKKVNSVEYNFFNNWINYTNSLVLNKSSINVSTKVDSIINYSISIFVIITYFKKTNNIIWNQYKNIIIFTYILKKNNYIYSKYSVFSIINRYSYIINFDNINQSNTPVQVLFNIVKKTIKINKHSTKYTQKKLGSRIFINTIKIKSIIKNKNKFSYIIIKKLIKNKYYSKKLKNSTYFNYKIPYKTFTYKKIKKIAINENYNYIPIKQKHKINNSINYKKSFYYKLYSTNYEESFIYGSNTNQIKNRIALLTNSNFMLYKVNALSLTRFVFEIDRKNELKKNELLPKKKTSAKFLEQLQKKLESRYRYVAKYIKDFVRITFFCLFLKKAIFLANFYAFILTKLPRKRKETKLIYFLIMALKIFSTHRPEIIGVRFKVKGRLNRWRRTKSISGQKGYINLYSYNSRIEFGIAQAITRKGTQGISIWLCYTDNFNLVIKKAIFDYIQLNAKKKNVSTCF